MKKKRTTLILISLVGAAFLLGCIGWNRYFKTIGEQADLSHIIYLTLQLYFFESGDPASFGTIPLTLNIARFFAPLAALGSAVIAFAYRFRKELQKAALRLFGREHIIFFGANEITVKLAAQYLGRGKTVLVADEPGDPDLTECNEAGALIFTGTVPHKSLLKHAAFHRAEEIFLFHEEDTLNYEGATRIYETLLSKRKQKRHVRCYIRCSNDSFKQLFLHHDLFTNPSDYLDVFFVDLESITARQLMQSYPPDYRPIKADSITRPHIILIGGNRMAEMVLQQALRICHFPNGKAPRITLFESNAEVWRETFLAAHPEILDLCDFQCLNTHVEGVEMFHHIGKIITLPEELVSVYICLEDDEKALSIGINLRRVLRTGDFLLYIRVLRNYSIPRLLSENSNTAALLTQVTFFGALEDICSTDVIEGKKADTLARAIHDSYREHLTKNSPADVDWHHLEETLKESNRAQADHIWVKLRAIGVDPSTLTSLSQGELKKKIEKNLEILSMMEHNRWIADRRLHGWIYGPVRNDSLRTHPDLVPWEKLSEEVKEYDRNAVRNIPEWLRFFQKEQFYHGPL